MAASQARLLSITARMHDIEYKAQAIQNAKIQLATQSDQVYNDYIAALDECTLVVSDINKNPVTVTFNNLFSKNPIETGNKYALREAKNDRLLVSDEIKDLYDDFTEMSCSQDAYTFAMYALDGNSVDFDKLEEDENAIYEAHKDDEDAKSLNDIKEKLAKDDLTDKERAELEQSFKRKLYNKYGSEIYEKNTGNEVDEFNSEDFQYYVNIFKQIQAAGGCESISDYDGPDGDAAGDSKFLQNMIQCGKFIISTVNEDKYGNVSFNETTPGSDTYISYQTTTTIDKTAYAKAEAEYSRKTKELDNKDKKFDMDLSKLETERTALDTEYKSVQKVIQENIERTFGIFS